MYILCSYMPVFVTVRSINWFTPPNLIECYLIAIVDLL